MTNKLLAQNGTKSQIEIPERRLTFLRPRGRERKREREQEPELNDDLDNDLVNYDECWAKEMRSICEQM